MNEDVKRRILAFLKAEGYDIPMENEDEVVRRFDNKRRDMGLKHSKEDYITLMDELGEEIVNPFKFIDQFQEDEYLFI